MKSGKWIPIVRMNEVNMGCVPDGSCADWKIVGVTFLETKVITDNLKLKRHSLQQY